MQVDISSLASSSANLFAGMYDVKNQFGKFDSILNQILANQSVSAPASLSLSDAFSDPSRLMNPVNPLSPFPHLLKTCHIILQMILPLPLTPMVSDLLLIQWNARSLNKAKLSEFRAYLTTYNPSIVLLSETHWSDSYTVCFKSYNCIVKNRPNNGKGGVAILIKKNIPFIPLAVPVKEWVSKELFST